MSFTYILYIVKVIIFLVLIFMTLLVFTTNLTQPKFYFDPDIRISIFNNTMVSERILMTFCVNVMPWIFTPNIYFKTPYTR